MSLSGSQGLKNGGGTATTLAPNATGGSLVMSGTVTALKFTSTQANGSNGVEFTTTGARLKLSSAGTTDYLESNGTTQLTAAGVLRANSGIVAVHGNGSNNIQILNSGTAQSFYLSSNNGVLHIYNEGATISLINFNNTGAVTLPTTDTSGTPGNATANTPTGKSAIAAGASSCVISNTLVTANSRILISPRVRDATGTLPIVSAQVAATSFTVSTVGNCTATLSFDWMVWG